MAWAEEVHYSRTASALLQLRRQTRLRRTGKIAEAEGSTGPEALVAVAAAVLSAVLLRPDRRQQQAKSAVRNFLDQLKSLWPHSGQRQQARHSICSVRCSTHCCYFGSPACIVAPKRRRAFHMTGTCYQYCHVSQQACMATCWDISTKHPAQQGFSGALLPCEIPVVSQCAAHRTA